MADRRRVSVKLELEVAQYLRGGAEALAITRKVSSSIDELGDESDETGRDMLALAANTDVATKQVDDLGDKALVTTGQLMVLERQLHSTGRAARGLDVTPDVGLGDLAGAGAAAGVQFGSSAARSFRRSGMHAMRGPLIGALVGAVAVFAPILGAMVAGAVSGAVGAGGIIGGTVSASRDPRVRAAARMTGAAISEDFFGRGGAFAEPTIRSLEILKQGFLDLDIEEVFAKAAPFVEDVAEGVVGFVEGFVDGMDRVLNRSGEIGPLLGEGLTELGEGLGDMIGDIAEAEGAMEGLRFLFLLTADVARTLGNIIEFLSAGFMKLGLFSARLSGALEDVVGWVPLLGDYVRDANNRVEMVTGTSEEFVRTLHKVPPGAGRASGAMLGLAGSARESADAAKEADDAWKKLNDEVFDSHEAALAVTDANLRQADAWATLREAVKEQGTSLVNNTEVGRDNRAMIQDLLHGILDIREANINNGMAIDEANRLYQTQVRQLKENLRQMGFVEAQIEDIIGDLERIPRVINSTIKIREVREGELIPKGGSRQHGGPVHAGVLYEVNEGPHREFFRAAVTGTVVPLSGMSSVAGPGGRAPVAAAPSVRPVVVNVGGPLSVQHAFDEFVREVGDRGGTLAVIGIRE